MRAPSGRLFSGSDVHLAREFARIKLIEWRDQPIRLKSGILSRVYVQGRDDLTSNPEVLVELARKILIRTTKVIMAADSRRPCFIGLPTAGTPLACAAAVLNYTTHVTLNASACFYGMREQKKVNHGVSGGWVIGKPMPDMHKYITIDNVVTDGQTKIEMQERFREDGFPIEDMAHLIVIDRQQGARAKMAAHGIRDVHVLFDLLDLTYLYRQLNLWPAEAVDMVEREIREHAAQS